MLSLAHFYDHTYHQDGQAVFSSGAFNRQSWGRYLHSFETVTVVGNLAVSNFDRATLNRVDAPRVSFAFVPNARRLENYLLYNVGRTQQLRRIIAAHDAIVVRLPSELGLTVARLAEKMGKPYAVEVVGCTWDAYWNHGSLKGRLLAPLSYWRMKRTISKAPYAIYVTEKFLQRRYPSGGLRAFASNVQIEVDPTGRVLAERLQKIDAAVPPLRIGLIGSSNVRYKGHRELIAALGGLRTFSFTLELVGPGETGWIRQLADRAGITDRVSYRGKLPAGRPILDFLDRLDLYVHPSRQEGLPRTVIEAMSRALPVLASNVAGIPELLPDRYLHDVGNVGQLQTTLRRYFESGVQERREMARTNFAKSEEYDHRPLAGRRKDFWQAVAAVADSKGRKA